MDSLLTAAGLLMALVAGVFLSFSDFVMRGLVQGPRRAGRGGDGGAQPHRLPLGLHGAADGIRAGLSGAGRSCALAA
jgi:hypothetical protein